jgi:hypothetical protein
MRSSNSAAQTGGCGNDFRSHFRRLSSYVQFGSFVVQRVDFTGPSGSFVEVWYLIDGESGRFDLYVTAAVRDAAPGIR